MKFALAANLGSPALPLIPLLPNEEETGPFREKNWSRFLVVLIKGRSSIIECLSDYIQIALAGLCEHCSPVIYLIIKNKYNVTCSNAICCHIGSIHIIST